MTDNRTRSPTQRSNSRVQKDAEGWILAALADAHPEIHELTPTKIVVGEAGAYVEVDGADSSTPTVVVEAYARQGVLKASTAGIGRRAPRPRARRLRVGAFR